MSINLLKSRDMDDGARFLREHGVIDDEVVIKASTIREVDAVSKMVFNMPSLKDDPQDPHTEPRVERGYVHVKFVDVINGASAGMASRVWREGHRVDVSPDMLPYGYSQVDGRPPRFIGGKDVEIDVVLTVPSDVVGGFAATASDEAFNAPVSGSLDEMLANAIAAARDATAPQAARQMYLRFDVQPTAVSTGGDGGQAVTAAFMYARDDGETDGQVGKALTNVDVIKRAASRLIENGMLVDEVCDPYIDSVRVHGTEVCARKVKSDVFDNLSSYVLRSYVDFQRLGG